MSDVFNDFAKAVVKADLSKARQAAAFLWWAEIREDKRATSIADICRYFAEARLPKPNTTRLEKDFRTSKHVTRADGDRYHLTHFGLEEGEALFGAFAMEARPEGLISGIALNKCPYITDSDMADAQTMAQLYVTLFSLENSVRRHIETILAKVFGPDWWEVTASASMKRKEQDRRANETQNKWIPSRSNSGPLYSLDWSDLVTLMRKYEELFRPLIDVNFLHRFSDLGNLRNVVAHNGVIEEPMQFKRVELAVHDWTKQLGPLG